MSVDQREPMGVHHLTVVPENFDPAVERDGDVGDVAADGDDDSDGAEPVDPSTGETR